MPNTVYVNGHRYPLLEDGCFSVTSHFVEGTILFDLSFDPPQIVDQTDEGISACKLRPLGHYSTNSSVHQTAIVVHNLPESATSHHLGKFFESLFEDCFVVEADIFRRPPDPATGQRRSKGRGYVMLQNPNHTLQLLQTKQVMWDQSRAIFLEPMDWRSQPPPPPPPVATADPIDFGTERRAPPNPPPRGASSRGNVGGRAFHVIRIDPTSADTAFHRGTIQVPRPVGWQLQQSAMQCGGPLILLALLHDDLVGYGYYQSQTDNPTSNDVIDCHITWERLGVVLRRNDTERLIRTNVHSLDSGEGLSATTGGMLCDLIAEAAMASSASAGGNAFQNAPPPGGWR